MKFFRAYLFLVLFFSPFAYAKPKFFGSLKPSGSWTLISPNPDFPRFDASGLMRFQNQFLLLSDRYEYQNIYRLETLDSKTMQVREYLKLRRSSANKSERPYLDLEGIGFCGGFFYLVEEENQMVMKVDPEGRVQERLIDLKSIHSKKKASFAAGTDSAGLEGVACDPDHQKLYVANERLFRMIYKIDLKTWEVEDFFDVPAGWELPRQEAGIPIFQDFSDLHFYNGFLYALQRIDRTILKIDPQSRNLVATLNLQFSEKDLYETREPFGMAEGLFMEDDKIYIVLDNNGMKRKGSQDIRGILMEFKKPKGF